MKKIIAITMLVSTLSASATTYISSWADLAAITNDLAEDYVLIANIDSNSVGYVGIGDDFIPIDNFSGSLNGSGHVISDLSQLVGAANHHSYYGLFGEDMSGAVFSLGVENYSITNAPGYYVPNCAPIAPQMIAGSSVSNCYATGSIDGSLVTGVWGGLVGGVESSCLVANSYSTVDIHSSASANQMAGFTFYCLRRDENTQGLVKNSFCSGDVTFASGSSFFANGFAGYANPYLDTCDDLIVNCGWVNHANNPTNASWCITPNAAMAIEYEESTINPFFVATHGVYTNTAPVWDFTSVWKANAGSLPTLRQQVIILTNTVSAEVVEPNSAEFSISVSGSSFSYQWYRDASPIASETNASYTIDPTSVILDNGAQFYVVYTNADVVATGAVATLTVTPQEIDSWADLQGVTNVLGGSYILTRNLSDGSPDYSGIGDAFTPIGHSFSDFFSGSFDGDGYIISDLVVSNTAQYNGLFGHVVNGSVVNVGIEDCSIFSGTYGGALVGKLTASVVSNCYSTGSLTGAYLGWRLGGLVGNVDGTNDIFNSYSMVDVLSNYGYYHGGFSGDLAGSVTIKNCYAGGDVSGDSQGYDGGFTGYGFIPTAPINCGWYNHAGNPAVAEDGDMTNSFTYEVTVAADLYSASHPIYTNTAPVWDFDSLWIANSSDYPSFGLHQGTWLVIAGVSRTNCFSIAGISTTNIFTLSGVL